MEKLFGNSQDVVYFGRINFRNQNRLFGIKRKDRRQHTYIIGKTGTGKTALLNNMAVQDIANGDGLCVVDPHGEFVEGLLEKIPPERMKDVIYFNPADTDYHIGFNVLELPDPKYKHLVASGLMGIFTKIWSNVWSARMEYILNNAILALLETPDSTLLGIPRLLVDKNFRQQVVNNIKDPVVKAFWIHEYESWREQFRNEAIAPIQNKVGQFLSTSIIRNIVGQSKSTIDIFDIMNQKKIFLVNVSKGRIGEDNSALLGAMLITKIQLAAMERVRITEEQRTDFFLYVDEFQNFATDSFAGILSEARKYRLNLVLAHQYVGQLVTDVSTKVRDAVFGNVGTIVVFRVGATDAEFLEPEFTPEFEQADIVNLPNYSVYLKLMVDGVTSRPFSANTLPPLKVEVVGEAKEKIIEESRRSYCRPRAIIEKEINKWSGMNIDEDEGEEHFTPAAATTPTAPSNPNLELFPATCTNCGKPTKVPFRPTPGKPVYCKECYDKFKAGEKMVEGPALAPRRFEPENRPTRHVPELANLGIEFEEKKEDIRPAPRPMREEQPLPSRPSGYDQWPRQPQETVSLNSLKPKDHQPKKPRVHTPPDMDSLRTALKQALNKKDSKE